MKVFDLVFEILLALAALTMLNRLVYQDGMLISLGYAVSIVTSFWIGRAAVRLFRRRKQWRRSSR